MKLSNNALNFLLAQYRAIFKRAYVKGIASAVLLTAGLAAGQAQANATDLTDEVLIGGLNNTYNVTGVDDAAAPNYTKMTIDGAVTGFNGTINITSSGQATQNIISGDGSLIGDGSIIINTKQYKVEDSTFPGLRVEGSTQSKEVKVDIGSVDLQIGSISLAPSASGSTINFNADTITIGSADIKDQRAVVNLGNQATAQDVSGSVTFGRVATATEKGTTLTLDGRGGIQMNGSSGSASVDLAADTIIMNGGTIRATNLATAGTNKITSHQVTMNNGNLEVEASGTVGLTLDLTARKALDSNGLALTTGDDIAGHFDVLGGNVKLANKLTIVDGTMTIADAAVLTASGESGSITVSGSDGNNPVLALSSKKLTSFLAADVPVTNGTKDNAGGVLLSGSDSHGGTLLISDAANQTIDIAAYQFSGSNTVHAGKISVYGAGYIKGENLTVSHKLTQDGTANGNDAGVSGSLSIVATNLTLGSTSADLSASLGFKDATARNLNVLAKDGNFELYDTVTLRSVDGTDNVVASDGTIQGDLTITSGKTLTVDGGIYQTNDDFTVNASGTLAVTNTKGANQSSLDLNRGINFNLSSSGEAKVTVDGGLASEYQAGDETLGKLTQLDLRDGIKATGTSGTAKISATSGGVVLVDDSDLNKIFAAAGSSTDGLSKVSFEISSGAALKAEGNVQMSFTDANASTLNNMLVLKEKGIFEADSLSITSSFSSDSGAKSGLGFTDATVRVDSLSITNNNSGASDAFLTGGTFEISNSLTVGNTLPLTLAASNEVAGSGDVTLKFDTGSNTATGTISAEDITNASANGKIIVAQGAWTATRTDFNLSSGTMTVGESGSQDTASLTAYELSVSGEGTFTVAASVGSATFDHLDAWSTDGVNVAGTLTINGDDVTVDTEDNPVAVHTNANSINVASTGTLNFGSKAVYNSIFGGTSGDTVLLKNSFAENTIDLAANGHVSLAFNDTTSLSAKQIVDLKKKLFNNDTEGSILGFINLGDAKIEDLKFDTDANGTPTITWDELQPVADVIGEGTGNDELAQAKVTGIDSTDQFKSPVGSVVSTDGSVTVAGNSSFNNAAGNNGLFVSDTTGKVGNAAVVNGSDVHLNGTGEIGTVSLSSTADNSSVLVTSNGSTNAPATVTIASISGDDTSTFSSRAAETKVTGDVDVGSMETLADTVTTVGGDITVANKADFAGTTDIKGNAEFAGAVDFSGITTFGGNVEITGDAKVTGNTTATAGNTALSGNMTIAEGCRLYRQQHQPGSYR